MKKSLLLLSLILLFHAPFALAQLSKAEKKALKKEIKEMSKNPEKFKALKEGIEEKKETLSGLESEISDIDQSIQKVEQNINEKNAKEKELIDEIARLRVEKKETQDVINGQTNQEGLVYKVQIEVNESALYKEISEETGEPRPVFSGEEDADGSKKYTLGYFKDKVEAETFRKYLKLLRINDAKIVAYENGKKISN